MESSKNPKIAIIGGGIAGCVLAMRLFLEYRIIPVIFDTGKINSSKVAAGLWNPVVFKRLTTGWMAHPLLQEVFSFYPKMESLLGALFFKPMPIYKFINDENEARMWRQKQNDADLYDIINPEILRLNDESYKQHLGYSQVLKSGFVNIPVFVEAVSNFLKSMNAYQTEEIDFNVFRVNAHKIQFHDFDIVVFAQGYKGIDNPFFDKVKFNLCRGDVLTFKADLPIQNAIVNNEGFIVPLGEGLYKIGSTYEWNNLSLIPMPDGLNKMKAKLEKLIRIPYEIVKHEVGIRPTLLDRKPVMGFHPQLENAYLFNGMGTKGVLLSPYFSKLAAEQIINNRELPFEISYNRFL